jgi:hypothetical protein
LTYRIECLNGNSRLKVARRIVNENGLKQCIELILAAWNRRVSENGSGLAP